MHNLNALEPKKLESIDCTKKYVNPQPKAAQYSNNEWKKQTKWLHSAKRKILEDLGIVSDASDKTFFTPQNNPMQQLERIYVSFHMHNLFNTSAGPIHAATYLLNRYTRAPEADIEIMEYLPPQDATKSPRIKIKLTNTLDFIIITFRTDTFPKRSIKNIKRLPQELFDGDFWLQSDSGDDNEVLERLKNGETITAITIELEGASRRKEHAQGRVGKMMTGVGTAPGRQRKITKKRPEDSLHEPDSF